MNTLHPLQNPNQEASAHARLELGLNRIRGKIANAMIGRAVDLLVSARRTRHGIVTAVDLASGVPKIIVAGLRYDLEQVLTVTPANMN